MKNVIRNAVEEEVRKAERRRGRRIKFPLLSSREPGSLDLTNAEIELESQRKCTPERRGRVTGANFWAEGGVKSAKI